MGRVVKWVLAVVAIGGLAILYLRRQMMADAATAKEEKLLRRVADGAITQTIDKMEAQIKMAAERAVAAEVAADEAHDNFEAALARARRIAKGE